MFYLLRKGVSWPLLVFEQAYVHPSIYDELLRQNGSASLPPALLSHQWKPVNCHVGTIALGIL